MKASKLIRIFSGEFLLVILCLAVWLCPKVWGIEVKYKHTDRPLLVYKGKALSSYGASPQNILTYLPKGNGNDIRDWVKWAGRFGINNVRSYPPSVRVTPPAEDLFQRSPHEPAKYDLTRFNNKYFVELRAACSLLREHGIIVHLQLWQAVYWKKAWDKCYYNPKNNINPGISAHAGPGEFVTMKNLTLLEHQKKYVWKILDSTGDLGNVFYDIMNEIGNGTGTSEEWVWEIIKTINQWEKEDGVDVLLTLNDEGGMRMGKFSLECPGLDLTVKDLGRYDEHVEARRKYGKPTISVRNIDYDYEKKKRRYFAGKYNLEVNTDPLLQTRGRKYWWRMFMAGVQIAGGYADTYVSSNFSRFVDKLFHKLGFQSPIPLRSRASYRLNQISEENFLHFRKFIDRIKDYETLEFSSGVLKDHPVPNSYCLQSRKQAIVYLESPNGKAGFHYDQKKARLTDLELPDGPHRGEFYVPATGESKIFTISLKDGAVEITIPPFDDDLAILIH